MHPNPSNLPVSHTHFPNPNSRYDAATAPSSIPALRTRISSHSQLTLLTPHSPGPERTISLAPSLSQNPHRQLHHHHLPSCVGERATLTCGPTISNLITSITPSSNLALRFVRRFRPAAESARTRSSGCRGCGRAQFWGWGGGGGWLWWVLVRWSEVLVEDWLTGGGTF